MFSKDDPMSSNRIRDGLGGATQISYPKSCPPITNKFKPTLAPFKSAGKMSTTATQYPSSTASTSTLAEKMPKIPRPIPMREQATKPP